MRVGLGLAALGRPGYINLQRDSHLTSRSMDELFYQSRSLSNRQNNDSGEEKLIPWLDCARSYEYTYVADWNVELGDGEPHEVKDHSLANFLKQVQETSEHIGDYVKLYQVHSATFDSGILTNKDVHEALHKCREEKGWSIGLSSLDQVRMN
ncbi:hypothetical protein ACHAWC_000801 [Mediolabrus comicus]